MSTVEIDLVQQAAETPCPWCVAGRYTEDGKEWTHETCEGTSLQWPSLSRVESCSSLHQGEYSQRHEHRVPDVTTDKLMKLFLKEVGEAKFEFCSDETYTIFWVKDEIASAVVGYTSEEALCVALLMTVEV